MKSGAVQNSPTDKSLPEPSPWSPVCHGFLNSLVYCLSKIYEHCENVQHQIEYIYIPKKYLKEASH